MNRVTVLLLIVVVLLLAIRPISNDDFWWHLSRGRAVLAGHLAASSFLLAGDIQNEADWLGGVPFYVVYAVSGLSGLMLLKITALCGLSAWCWRQARSVASPLRLLVTLSFGIVVLNSCQPTPVLWDVLALLCCTVMVRRTGRFTLRNVIEWAVLTIVWANLGALSILFLLPLISEWLRSREGVAPAEPSRPSEPRRLNGSVRASPSHVSDPFLNGEKSATALSKDADEPALRRRDIASLALVGVLGICLTPRGVFTPWDSLRQLVPMLSEAPDILCDTTWRPMWLGPLESEVIAWGVLSLIGIIGVMLRIRREPGHGIDVLLFLTVQSLAVWSRANAVVLSVWLAGWVIDQCHKTSQVATGEMVRQRFWRPSRWLAHGVCLFVGGLAFLGCWPFEGARCGWGLSRRLDVKLFAESLKSHLPTWDAARMPGTVESSVHCLDVRSAGMLIWSRQTRSKPYFIAQRALLNGRLREEVLLNRELESGWLKQHQRADGTGGGWWLTLRARNTLLLVTSAERTRLIRSLDPTIWKPLSLESPVIAYGLAGYPTLTSRIADVVAKRELVDRGTWTFQPESAAGNDRLIDGLGLITGWPDPDPILRQAAVLRALQLPMAAMRVLRPLLSQAGPSALLNRSRLRAELIGCQIDLAEREFLATGQFGTLRRYVLVELIAETSARRLPDPDSSSPIEHEPAKSTWVAAVRRYLAGDPHGAASLLEGDDPAIMASRAMLEWEAGFPTGSREIWVSLRQRHPGSRYALASRYVLEAGNY